MMLHHICLIVLICQTKNTTSFLPCPVRVQRPFHNNLQKHSKYNNAMNNNNKNDNNINTKSSALDVATSADNQKAIDLGRTELARNFNFPLDDWQLQAGGEILLGNNVIVCAPTGSGKTVCGEMALHFAYNQGLNGIYTTPLKALSNQKFAELCQVFGTSNVGLSTGDISVNRQAARLTVMTTEVYRNIAWRSPASETESTTHTDDKEGYGKSNDLTRNAVVVLDEFHYMGVPGRGGVWEECIITSPSHTQIIGLSATLPNAFQLAEWMESVTGRKTVLVEAPGARPVPLKYLFATREGIYPLFRNPDAGPGSPSGLLGYRGDGIPEEQTKKTTNESESDDDDSTANFKSLPKGLQINPNLKRIAKNREQQVNKQLKKLQDVIERDRDSYDGQRRSGQRGSRSFNMSAREEKRERERLMKRLMRKAVPSLPSLLSRLQAKDLLPAIIFIFSRAGCDNAAASVAATFKGPRDPTVDIEFEDGFEGDDEEELQRRKSRQRGKRKLGRGGGDTYEDTNGRNFRMASNNIDEDTFNILLEGQRMDLVGKVISGSPLSSENWNFFSAAGLLSHDQVAAVAERTAYFNNENPEIAFTDDVVEQFMFGVGSHHAGMLPAHKAFVEALYRGGLMKVVFATETLAAGINMPARTTVVCALAKRSDSKSMKLLETSNLLQMAGRAGRRGMDTSGSCVLVATPFESHEEAASILTNPVKPITSQFRPSYALAVNLIGRGRGKLDVARQLVSKSFARWEKQQLEDKIVSASQQEGVREVLGAVAEEKFMSMLVNVLENMSMERKGEFTASYLQDLVDNLKDRELLKKSSKEYQALLLSLDLEEVTLSSLEVELRSASGDVAEETDETVASMLQEDLESLQAQVEEQRQRVIEAQKKMKKHPFTATMTVANEVMKLENGQGRDLSAALAAVRGAKENEVQQLDSRDLPRMAKSAVVVKRQLRRLAKSNPEVDPVLQLTKSAETTEDEDPCWDDMLAMTKVLLAYGCLECEGQFDPEDFESQKFVVTPAGSDVGSLSFANSLWCFAAMGGACDVTGASAQYDQFNYAMDFFNLSPDEGDERRSGTDRQSTRDAARKQAEELLFLLRRLSAGEIAGYVSCLVAGDSSRNSFYSTEALGRITPAQREAIFVLLDATDRLAEVQKEFSVDERSCQCSFDVSHCEVVTAWANGCSWSEALEMSQAAPGDLIRIIARAMDGLRQFGSLPFRPLRKGDVAERAVVDPLKNGIHPDVRRLCREAARKMNRYPVKDQLPVEAEEEDLFESEELDSTTEAEIDANEEDLSDAE